MFCLVKRYISKLLATPGVTMEVRQRDYLILTPAGRIFIGTSGVFSSHTYQHFRLPALHRLLHQPSRKFFSRLHRYKRILFHRCKRILFLLFHGVQQGEGNGGVIFFCSNRMDTITPVSFSCLLIHVYVCVVCSRFVFVSLRC